MEYLRSPSKPTAIFACNDMLAIGAIQAIREMNLSIPDDISVMGFDNTMIATIIDPGLTTMAQPIENMGREVMDLILAEIDGQKKYTSRIVLNPVRVIRRSTSEVNKVNTST